MERGIASTFPRLAAVAVALFSISATADFTTSYCSTQNTGTSDDYFWQWQSNGKCTDHCNSLGTYAFAVIKYTDCWCSNYIPASQADTSDCQVDCPGYPAEKCGDKDKGLYIYIQLAGSPSGTQGSSAASSTVSSTTSPPSSTAKPPSSEAPTRAPASPTAVTSAVSSRLETVAQTVTSTTPVPTVRSTITSVSTTETTKASTTLKTTAKPSTTEEPMTLSTVVTESGVIVTRTVVVTPTSDSSASASGSQKSNTGAIVGGVVGGLAGLLAIVGAVFFLLWRKRKQQREEQDGHGSSGITRNTSTMSKAGLLGGHGVEKDMQYPPPILTNMESQRSRHEDSSNSPMTLGERRYSQPVLVDSRLNPRAVLTFHGSNESRDSIGSIDDSRDYGRQLNVVNPDRN